MITGVHSCDLIARPMCRIWRYLYAGLAHLREVISATRFGASLIFLPDQRKAAIRRFHAERAEAQRAISADPNNAAAWGKLGDAFAELKRPRKAIICYETSLSLSPDRLHIWRKYRATLRAAGRPVLAGNTPAAHDGKAWALHAGWLWVLKRYPEAAQASDRALELNPHNHALTQLGLQSRLLACDWSRRDEDKRVISAGINSGLILIDTFFHRSICDSEEESFLLAKNWAARLPIPEPLWRGETYRHKKIRIAYLSRDLHQHVVGEVVVGCFEHHDRGRFETTAVSLGPDDESNTRRRIRASFERFVDAREMNDKAIAAFLRKSEIDIVIDLNGSPGASRRGITAHRAAPLQVNFLGYPGTNGASFFDYIIADPILIPEENQKLYSEKIAYLPHTYLPTDRKRIISAATPSRRLEGLPETGFVFAAHHPSQKINPELFGIWMRLLRSVDGSVLWLRANEAAMSNLRREATARDVAPERLVFARHETVSASHLARLRLADLFLDALPYNAHSSGSDALWASLPVLTCMGRTFAGRVGAGLLVAVGLPELVTSCLVEYEEIALKLARNPDQLAALKDKLIRNRRTEPLFDTARFTENLETAYATMWERQQAGFAPETFAVSG